MPALRKALAATAGPTWAGHNVRLACGKEQLAWEAEQGWILALLADVKIGILNIYLVILSREFN